MPGTGQAHCEQPFEEPWLGSEEDERFRFIITAQGFTLYLAERSGTGNGRGRLQEGLTAKS